MADQPAGKDVIISSMCDATTFWYITTPDLTFDVLFKEAVHTDSGPFHLDYRPVSGEVVAVLDTTLRKWLRAEVQSVYEGRGGELYSLFCLDYGVIVKDVHGRSLKRLPKGSLCQDTPPFAKKFQLANLVPIKFDGSFFAQVPRTDEPVYCNHWCHPTFRFVSKMLSLASKFTIHLRDQSVPGITGIEFGDLDLMIDGKLQNLSDAICQEGLGNKMETLFPNLIKNQRDDAEEFGYLRSGLYLPEFFKWQTSMQTFLPPQVKEPCASPIESDEPASLSTSAGGTLEPTELFPVIPEVCELEKKRLEHMAYEEDQRNKLPGVSMQALTRQLAAGSPKVFFDSANNPGEIYIRLHKNDAKLKELEANIEHHAKSREKKPRSVALTDWKKDMYCIAKYKDHWYRAKIIDMHEDDTVTCFFVDHGDSSTVSLLTDVMKIQSCHLLLFLFQAIKCRLVGVEFVEGEKEWQERAIDAIYDLTVDAFDVTRELFAKVCTTSRDDQIPAVLLGFYVPGLNTVSLVNRILIEMNVVGSTDDEIKYLNCENLNEVRE